jgi:DNA-binding transcriptional ArsR family regulator/catechol 2,3-dioxygenase-like lactoylglutathione lyase family enzyme
MEPPTPEERIFHAVADPTRRALLDRLSSGEHSAGELAAPFAMSQPAISQHLSVLRRAGLVRSRRVGRRRVYRIRARPIERVREWASRFAPSALASGWEVTPVRLLGRVLEFRDPREAVSPITRVHAVPIAVADLDATVEFYRDGLGLSVRRDQDARGGGRTVELSPPGAETAIELSTGAGGRGESDPASVVLSCRDLVAARRYLSDRGIPIVPATAAETGGRSGLRLRDPEGRALLLVEEA